MSIVCVSYNDLAFLKLLFQSLRNQTFHDFEIVVVDNAGNENVRKYVESFETSSKQHIVYVQNDNEGYTGGNIRGVRFGKGDFIFIVNPDTSIAETAIESLVTDFSRRPDHVMVLVPKIMIRQTDLINSIGMKRIRPSENLYTNIGYLEHDKGQYDISQEVAAFDGSAFMFRKELLHHTYLFDVRFFFGNETVDLAERMSNLGLSAWTCPKAVVRHELRGTVRSSKENDRLISIIVRNSLIHTLRNTKMSMFVRTLIIGILVRNVFGRLALSRSNSRLAFLYMRGVIMFILELGSFAGAVTYDRKPLK